MNNTKLNQIMAKATRTETHIPDNERPINVFIHKKTTHFHDMVENTNEFKKYTEEQYEADLQKWFNDTSYTKRQTNWTEKYTHVFKQWSGEIKDNKIYSKISTSATPINTKNLDINEMIEILQLKT